MLAIAQALPSYYVDRYGIHGLGDPLDASSFTCASDGKFYICRPKTAAVADQVKLMQQTIDSFLTKLPIFRDVEIDMKANPIGSSSSGYDGRVGPVTSGVGEVALLGAAEMQRAAGEGDPPADIIVAMRDFSVEKNRTENFARYAPSITSYLQDMVVRFDAILAKIRARRDADNLPVVVAPPPLPVPADIQASVKKGISKGWIIGGAAAAVGLAGLAAYSMRDKDLDKHGKPKGKSSDKIHWDAKHPAGGGAAFMGARTRSRKRRR